MLSGKKKSYNWVLMVSCAIVSMFGPLFPEKETTPRHQFPFNSVYILKSLEHVQEIELVV